MSCQIMVPAREVEEDSPDKKDFFETVQGYDLDVIPLKEEDTPHGNFCLVLDKEKGVASYVPLPSRIQLSTGRPSNRPILRAVRRRPETSAEKTEREERIAEIDLDMAEKHHMTQDDNDGFAATSKKKSNPVEKTGGGGVNKGDDGEDDFGDDDDDSEDSGDEALFGGANTIVAES
mmetsp:Transcript_19000/g.24468  ORF Transcript_19000/g.24468 Transcript_19000/m.24468 type:complete len:176 (+) Transcript_19000:3-530(+)